MTSLRRGFTMVELGLTIVVISLLTAFSVPRIGPLLSRSRVNQIAAVVAADLETAFAIAGRQRRPVRLSCVCASVRYQVADRSDGTLRLSRTLSGDEESGVTALTFSTTPVDIFPSGIASSPLTVTISAGGYSRDIQMTTAGQVRILPP
jgi:prepilin-type N-terminal cleavage/methylation domain-containing protein